MEILLCIDDTDDLEKGKGTGSLAQTILTTIEENRWGQCERITRHQLLLHEDIPYTSHNSSMCFAAEIEDEHYKNVIDYSMGFLKREHAEGSDPGLCVVKINELKDKQSLIEFGKKAQKEVLTKERAYGLARSLDIHLTEHGGTGLGIIGALAGTGLRLSGNDGEFKGGLKFVQKGEVWKAGELYKHDEIDVIMSLDGKILKEDEKIIFGLKSKTIFRGGKSLLLVVPQEINEFNKLYKCCNKQQLRNLGDDINVQ
jgi:hypothetical protein